MNLFISILFFVLGAILGSALHSLAMRSFFSWLQERAKCENCQKSITWYGLLPIFSYLFLKGRLSCCKQKISFWHFFIELIGGLGGISLYFSYMEYGFSPGFFIICIGFLTALFTIALDARKHLISITALSLSSIFIIILGFFLMDLHLRIVGVLIGGSFFLLQWISTKGRGIGSGDIYLGAFMGLILGHIFILPAILIGYIIGSIHAIILLLQKKAGRKTELPLGVYLSIGFLLMLFYGHELTNLYLTLLN